MPVIRISKKMIFAERIVFLLVSFTTGIIFCVNCNLTEKVTIEPEISTKMTLRDKINHIKFSMGEDTPSQEYTVDLDAIAEYFWLKLGKRYHTQGLSTEPSKRETSRKKRVYRRRTSRATQTTKSRKTSFGTRKPYARKIINNSNRLFIYGTMKKGEPEHHWLKEEWNGKSTYITDGLTFYKYPLIILGQYNTPSILNFRGVGHQIYGEVYEMDDIMFDKIDDIEGAIHAKVRIEEDILYADEEGAEKKMPCWVYVKWFHKGKLNASQLLTNYHSRGSHGLPFIDWNTTRSRS